MDDLFPRPDDLPPRWELEYDAREAGFNSIAGVDEVGRGTLAGPVVAAAVILPYGLVIEGVRDSKKMTPAQRERAVVLITAQATAVGLGAAGPGEIDRINILQASLLAMRRAVAALRPRPDFLLVDGNQGIGLDLPGRTVVKGDDRSVSIAAASIVAKVTRDRMMVVLDRVFPGYGFARHKGYSNPAHRRAIEDLGPTYSHRRTFRGVKEWLR